MSKTIVSGITLTLLISMLTLAFNIQPVKAYGTIHIRADGSIDPPTANITSVDDITYIFTDNNHDSIVVEKDNIVVDGAGCTLQGAGTGIGIDLSYRDNVTIKNAKVSGFSLGIQLYYSNGNTLSENNITENVLAVYLQRSVSNTLSGNNIIATSDCCIILSDSSNNNTVSDNIVTNSREGDAINLYRSNNNLVYENILLNCSFGIYLREDNHNNVISNNTIIDCPTYGIGVVHQSSNNTLSGNKIINSDQGICLSGARNNTISRNNLTNNEFGISLGWSSNNTISGNNITNNGYGLEVAWSSNNNINGNNMTNNAFGVYFEKSLENTISGNTIINNEYGVTLVSGGRNTICGNIINSNFFERISIGDSSNNSIFDNTVTSHGECGINLWGSSIKNFVYHNNFVDNTLQVEYLGIDTIWDDGYPSGGNYWSDYTGVDLYSGSYQNETGIDGIGDMPYTIDEDIQDNYPLIEPWRVISGNLQILEPINGSMIPGSINITFTIQNTGGDIEFFKGDSSNRIDLEIEYASGETYGWGIQFWSTGDSGLALKTRETYTQTVLYDPSEHEEAVPPDFTGEAPYGEITIRLVHWKQNDEEPYGYGEFSIIEIKIILTFHEDLNLDRKVDIKDIALASISFGSFPSHPKWNPIADINHDSKVDIRDLALIASNFGKTYS